MTHEFRATRRVEFSETDLAGDLDGRSIGVIGMGDIGREVSRIARAGFGLQVVTTTRRPETAPEGAEAVGMNSGGIFDTDDIALQVLAGNLAPPKEISPEGATLARAYEKFDLLPGLARPSEPSNGSSTDDDRAEHVEVVRCQLRGPGKGGRRLIDLLLTNQ